jgi:hypothetical protein
VCSLYGSWIPLFLCVFLVRLPMLLRPQARMPTRPTPKIAGTSFSWHACEGFRHLSAVTHVVAGILCARLDQRLRRATEARCRGEIFGSVSICLSRSGGPRPTAYIARDRLPESACSWCVPALSARRGCWHNLHRPNPPRNSKSSRSSPVSRSLRTAVGLEQDHRRED